MGYYNSNDKKTGKRGYFASSFTGLIAGALLVGVILPGVTDAEPETAVGATTTESVSGVQTTSTVVTSDVTEIVEQTNDAVVGVSNLQMAQQNPFSAPTATDNEAQEAGAGSGVIYKKDGDTAYIVTNNHVVEGAEDVMVTLSDGTELDAEVLGTDVWTDLAVLKVPSKSIETVAEFGDSSVLKAGEPVIAIGNPLGLQFSGSVTTGVISGTERLIPIDVNQDGTEDWQSEVLQTDAAINPGNSGGALINAKGQLIGINSMKIAQAAVEGIGLAIPINTAIPIIADLETEGAVERPSMGVAILDLAEVPAQYRTGQLGLPAEVEGGIVVQSVVEGSGAATAGMEAYDVIVELDGKPVKSILELRQYLYNETEVGDTLEVKAYRGGELMSFELELTESM
ncbi:trypsin-like peptidase domain-containing protein [Microbacterium sp. APC 3898]|uniref:Trypsin-like peptidase domain-containing protein n=1 Tax=Planococcus notacanthi TaxID=3035188 RepID=A0ABT7ZKE7_9BACL|nr:MULTISPECIES: trypsin-like peptidase domain-containing protein [Terrabacteria group]MBF6633132.1 trypsin-like peptidase domain-containing protein [Planococcus sp. (in: firmicutes)]MDN3427635.1 trypsin-like peptidase domain-containing protein [Planococcus sp. APC 4016]MDN3499187.1 trypsin-like peptidase domain-containing protein [Microbacterium sp. APC 3898]